MDDTEIIAWGVAAALVFVGGPLIGLLTASLVSGRDRLRRP